MNEIILSTQNGEPVASSREVAKRFGKEHKNVLTAIRQLLVAENSATKFFHESAFEYRGQKFPEYLMNRDGFSLLAMGFTGKEAVQWKLKYIEAFNTMEKQLTEQRQEELSDHDKLIRQTIRDVALARRNLAVARRNHETSIESLNSVRKLLSEAHSLYDNYCKKEKEAAQTVRNYEIDLDRRINYLNMISFDFSALEETSAGKQVELAEKSTAHTA